MTLSLVTRIGQFDPTEGANCPVKPAELCAARFEGMQDWFLVVALLRG